MELFLTKNYVWTEELMTQLLQINQDKFTIDNNLVKTTINVLTQKIDLIDLHMKYAPTGEGAEAAKKEFLQLACPHKGT